MFIEWIEGTILKSGGMDACGYILENNFTDEIDAGFQKGERALYLIFLLQILRWTWFCSREDHQDRWPNLSTLTAQSRTATHQTFRNPAKTMWPLSHKAPLRCWLRVADQQLGQVFKVNSWPQTYNLLPAFCSALIQDFCETSTDFSVTKTVIAYLKGALLVSQKNWKVVGKKCGFGTDPLMIFMLFIHTLDPLYLLMCLCSL